MIETVINYKFLLSYREFLVITMSLELNKQNTNLLLKRLAQSKAGQTPKFDLSSGQLNISVNTDVAVSKPKPPVSPRVGPKSNIRPGTVGTNYSKTKPFSNNSTCFAYLSIHDHCLKL